MMPFSTGTRLERVGVVGPDLDCCCADRQVLNVARLCKKDQKEEGSARALPLAASMPKSVSF